MSQIKLTVIAPVFNEEQVIEAFHARLSEVLASLDGIDANVIYVVDRCTDNTLAILRVLAKRDSITRVIALSSRFGHQMSLVAGIDNALDSDAIIMMDCDLQHPPELIPDLINIFRNGFDVVYTVRKDTEEINPFRRMAGNLFYKLITKLSHIPMHSNVADFRLISGRVAKILSTDFSERNMFLRGIFSWIGFRQAGIEYVAHKRAGGRSKYSLSRVLQLATAGVLSFSTKPLRLGIFMGCIFSLFAFILSIWMIAEFFFDSTIPSGWTTLVVLLLMFSGIQLIVLGIIGAYIGGIFDEVKNRPRYIIDEQI
ncbi:glycosyltransferase family 2 protein [Polynucleobacter sp. AP-Sanab-80-C2]|uniref:glycosyltransferase family 2 protein n=1 Tax=Polynucleobacter sp. AP-Sanab-80-C2 TaxID=3108274 RepID=UPI002B222586|nr:glycosyltransferase family 2 protein [Polynucleobacter sp. AP-Sanab-80-C2]MEA9598526.1 glycosyltransferase family 2 protein [Polynucleobacter sp. AP-Sanab-80-C2]